MNKLKSVGKVGGELVNDIASESLLRLQGAYEGGMVECVEVS